MALSHPWVERIQDGGDDESEEVKTMEKTEQIMSKPAKAKIQNFLHVRMSEHDRACREGGHHTVKMVIIGATVSQTEGDDGMEQGDQKAVYIWNCHQLYADSL